MIRKGEDMALLDFLRPEPEFSPGQLVLIDTHFNQIRYLLVERRRWVKPHAGEKQWVYDGTVLSVRNDRIFVLTYSSCLLEEALVPIIKDVSVYLSKV